MDIIKSTWEALAKIPIPTDKLELLRQSRKTYKIEIDVADSRYCDPGVDVREWLRGENHLKVMTNPRVPLATDKLIVRKQFSTKLVLAEFYLNRLSERKLSLFIEDAHRSIALQRDRYEYNLAKARKQNPGQSKKFYREYMRGQYTEVPSDNELATSPPPHCTAGATDYVAKHTGNNTPLCMGGKGKELSQPDYYEQEIKKRWLEPDEIQALENRRVLYWLMDSLNLAPSPTEFWHVSFGDQMWAEFQMIVNGQKAVKAFYGLFEA